ncbi:MAG TPA: hypothetical protein VNW04_15190 [Puia sp.]|jgi:hypothetical protein|nr:hypothetical protein [Puia sp.]
MKQLFTLSAVAVVTAMVGLSSCSSSRNAQTTDDIYYSSGGKKTTAGSNQSGGASQGDYYSTAPSDNYVRMKAQDPARWSYFDDYGAYDSYYAPVSASVGYGYPAYGFGYGYPTMGLGYGYGMGMGYGMGFGLGFGDPYMCWNSYFLWNSWYNPYFYNPYYGGAVFVVGHSTPTAIYSNLRPFNSVAYRNGLGHNMRTTTGTGGRFYRPGMATTSNYNSGLSGQGRPVNNTFYRPSNSNNGGFRPAQSFSQPSRSYSPSMGGGGGGGGFSRPGRH